MILGKQNVTLEAIKQETHATDTTVIYLNSHANKKTTAKGKIDRDTS